MSSTQDYLKKYMSKPASLEEYKKQKLKKKKKSTHKDVVKRGNFVIHDEDEMTWKANKSDSDDDLPMIADAEGNSIKVTSSSWATIQEGNKSAREEALQRNIVPEWDDVENEEERPAIAGMVVESESSARLRKAKVPATKEWKSTSKRHRSPSPESKSLNNHARSSTSPPPRSSERGRRSASPSSPSSHSHSRRSRSRSFSPSKTVRQGQSKDIRMRSRSRSASVERMSSGAAVGLQSAKQVKADMDRRQQQHLDRMKALDPSKSGRDSETVYRDARGRKVDKVAERMEAAEAARKEIEKQERQMEWGKGLVQRENEQEKKRKLEEEKFKPLARFKDDEELNEELKDKERWNDPAAKFLTGVKKSKKNIPKFPQYQGSYQPNRYNIPPGYRWDGVDRSTGFEKEYFKRANLRKHNIMEAHLWSTEDM